MSVLLPHPDGPRMDRNCPVGTSSDTPSKARTDPSVAAYVLETPASWISGRGSNGRRLPRPEPRPLVPLGQELVRVERGRGEVRLDPAVLLQHVERGLPVLRRSIAEPLLLVGRTEEQTEVDGELAANGLPIQERVDLHERGDGSV